MLAIAGQTAAPNKLNFFEKTHGYPRGNLAKKNQILFLSKRKRFFF